MVCSGSGQAVHSATPVRAAKVPRGQRRHALVVEAEQGELNKKAVKDLLEHTLSLAQVPAGSTIYAVIGAPAEASASSWREFIEPFGTLSNKSLRLSNFPETSRSATMVSIALSPTLRMPARAYRTA